MKTPKRFSDREGITKPRSKLQIDGMDEDLRTALWNEFYIAVLQSHEPYDYLDNSPAALLYTNAWLLFWTRPMDDLGKFWDDAKTAFRNHYFAAPWYEVYNLIEFVIDEYDERNDVGIFVQMCNNTFEIHGSAYRIVANRVAPITSEAELSTIQGALDDTESLQAVHTHLASALDKLSQKPQPDFRNSIKESVSAVEALCRLITRQKKITLGDALELMKKRGVLRMHEALSNGLSSIYG